MLAAATAVVIGAVLGLAPGGSATTRPGPRTISTKPFVLTRSAPNSPALAALLASAGTVTLQNLLAQNGPARAPLCHTRSLARLVGPVRGFCWQRADDRTCHDMPQGLTTSQDALGPGYRGAQYVVASWYHRESCTNGTASRSHITVVDWGPKRARYAKVLLVRAALDVANKPTFIDVSDVDVHAGGVVWYGNLLFLADTVGGFRVFDMNKIIRTNPTLAGVGRVGGQGYSAHGFRYVLPEIAETRQVGADRSFKFSTIGLDRRGPAIVVAEYRKYADQAGGRPARALRFALDPMTHRLVEDSAHRIRPTNAYRTTFAGVNGVVAFNNRWWFASSRRATLYSWLPGWPRAKAFPWTGGAESLSYWVSPQGPDLLWNLREKVGDKNVFTVEQRRYH